MNEYMNNEENEMPEKPEYKPNCIKVGPETFEKEMEGQEVEFSGVGTYKNGELVVSEIEGVPVAMKKDPMNENSSRIKEIEGMIKSKSQEMM